ncbi:uncharacterized protein F4812DRAFT_160643 [Daldinia caldariorum]|uniref:uncharacterized protein n=1 Tax=Daldinia caldariorum TaxID=326644 RepID=UPI002007F428|nr:uncharacterized protein F4812DRAFT_160643 [Daldinia caldariorum]KAI1464599.1 hypothetical protein F4812DRAFT_160643 [Daldinia caldariorum]
MMSDIHTLANLQKTYVGPHAIPASLNTPFREALKSYAASQKLQFSEDSIGNNYITRGDRDADIAPIAIAFPLDGGLSESAFISAFRLFSLLSEASLPCNLMLVGWTYSGSRLVGQELWELSATTPSYEVPSELQEFQGKASPKDVSFSAIFQASEEKRTPLRIDGSPVLVEKARKLTTVQADVRQSHKKTVRAPWISITGPGAEDVAMEAIKEYSAYIVALFDNFD